jgi:hypothetical protein
MNYEEYYVHCCRQFRSQNRKGTMDDLAFCKGTMDDLAFYELPRIVPELLEPFDQPFEEKRFYARRGRNTLYVLDKWLFENLSRQLEQLAENIASLVEHEFFGCRVLFNRLGLFESVVVGPDTPPKVSELWHYDNHPHGAHKVFIYLTDVDKGAGPFLWVEQDGKPLTMPPTKVGRGKWAKGSYVRHEEPRPKWKVNVATGPRGSRFIFSHNIMHRRSLARERPRRVLCFELRPYHRLVTPRIHPKWTSTSQRRRLLMDPFRL